MDGLILVDKKEGWTSYDVVRLVKKIYNTNKVGHCGTLDPFASGLLIIGVNQATKVMSFLENDDKEYIATIQLGSKTDTYDLTGKVVSTSKIIPFTKSQVENVLKSFKGRITQTPPIYSSIHVDGKHLYEYARNHEEVKIPEREVTIYDLKLLDFNDTSFQIYVKCSKGTYIRTLGVDIAFALKNEGHLTYLRRISIGKISVKDANSYSDLLANHVKMHSIMESLNMKNIMLKDKSILKRVYNGQDIILKQETADRILIMDEEKAIAIYRKIEDALYHCVRGLFDEKDRFEKLARL